VLWRVTEIVDEISSSEYAIDHRLSRLRWKLRKLTAEVLAGWKAWAAEHARAFQRASAAVEGRNGYLSQMQHNHRGLPTRRYQVWTALHNFDGRATDGTTPASRFFRRSFPDLFESILSQVDELPLPRQRLRYARQGLEGAGCPA
jgi:hypothetical protein